MALNNGHGIRIDTEKTRVKISPSAGEEGADVLSVLNRDRLCGEVLPVHSSMPTS